MASQHYKKTLKMASENVFERKKLIILMTIFGALLSFFYFLYVPESYTAKAKIFFTTENNSIDNKSPSTIEMYDLQAQLEIMRSAELIKNVITIHDASEDIESFQKKLEIHHIEDTTLATVSFQSHDPVIAANIVNDLIDRYSELAEANRKEQFRTTIENFSERLEILRNDIRQTESKFKNQLDENEVSISEEGDENLNKIKDLNIKINNVRDALNETELILEKLDAAINEQGYLENVPYYATTPVFDDLRMIEAELDAKSASYNGEFDADHPEMKRLKKESDAFQEVLNKETAEYIETLKTKRSIEKAELKRMENEISVLKDNYQNNELGQDPFKKLLDQADTSRALLDSFNDRYKKEMQRLDNNAIVMRIITKAVPPQKPDRNHIFFIITGGAAIGFLIGLIVAFLIEKSSHKITSASQLEKIGGYPLYGLLPYVRKMNNSKPADFILNNPSSMLAESIRSLLTTIQMRDPDKRGGTRVITLTSTYSGEGKTTNAIWLATIAAQSGKKTLIIDADMRSPSLHKAYGIGNAKGIVDFLSDRLPLDEIIYKNHTSGAHIITSKAIPTYAVMLLANARMNNMLRRLKDLYDIIIIDAPASLLFSDARLLANHSDKLLYTVEWKKADFSNLIASLKQFSDMNYNNIAFILNKINHNSVMSYNNALQKDLEYFKKHVKS